MANWNKVKYIKNIKITVDGGQSSSSIFGNERNCAVVTISYNGMNDELDDPYVDLSGVKVGPYTYMIDFDTGVDLPWETMPDDMFGLYYNYHQGKHCNSPGSAPIGPASDKRAYVTYYVYGKCTLDMKRMTGVRIQLPTGEVVSTIKESGDPHKVDILIKRPIQYSTSDLEPIEWVKFFESRNTAQWSAFAKLKKEFKTSWVDYKFELYPTHEGELIYVSRTTRNHMTHYFYLCPLGKESSHSIHLAANYNINILYNQEPGALCVIRLKALTDFFNDVENYTDYGYIRLYDTYGNQGVFQLNFTSDPLNPTFITKNV